MSIGLVFAGGGGKGSYQIGVWKALNKLGIEKSISAVAGTSVGALNAALFMNGSCQAAENIWCNISAEKVLIFNGDSVQVGNERLNITANDINYLMSRINEGTMIASKQNSMWPNITKGIFSKEGLIDIINKNLNIEKVKSSPVLGIATCTLMPWVIPKYFILNNQTSDKLKSILLASSAFPIAFGFEKIDNHYYIDGGVTDNIPIEILYVHGYNRILVVNLTPQDKIVITKYHHADILEISPTKDLGNIKTGTFDFDKEHAIARIEQGYNDTISLKDKLFKFVNS